MFGSMKKAMVAAAVVAVGAMAGASGASAGQWYADGNLVGGAPGLEVVGSGTLAFTMPIAAGVTATKRCDVEIAANLYNQGGGAHGEVTGVGVPVPADCEVTSNIPGAIGSCVVTAITPNLMTPWSIGVSGASLTISGVDYTFTYDTMPGGPTCALRGSRQAAGSVTGTWSNPGMWDFTNAGGLLINGSAPSTVNGGLEMVGEAGGEEITLQ